MYFIEDKKSLTRYPIIQHCVLGFYAATVSEKGWGYDGTRYKAELSASTTRTHARACLSFHYMLNGEGILSKNAINVYWKTPKGDYFNSPFSKGSHMGTGWFYATINMGRIEAGTKVNKFLS